MYDASASEYTPFKFLEFEGYLRWANERDRFTAKLVALDNNVPRHRIEYSKKASMSSIPQFVNNPSLSETHIYNLHYQATMNWITDCIDFGTGLKTFSRSGVIKMDFPTFFLASALFRTFASIYADHWSAGDPVYEGEEGKEDEWKDIRDQKFTTRMKTLDSALQRNLPVYSTYPNKTKRSGGSDSQKRKQEESSDVLAQLVEPSDEIKNAVLQQQNVDRSQFLAAAALLLAGTYLERMPPKTEFFQTLLGNKFRLIEIATLSKQIFSELSGLMHWRTSYDEFVGLLKAHHNDKTLHALSKTEHATMCASLVAVETLELAFGLTNTQVAYVALRLCIEFDNSVPDRLRQQFNLDVQISKQYGIDQVFIAETRTSGYMENIRNLVVENAKFSIHAANIARNMAAADQK